MKKIEVETWKPIPGYAYYEASSLGRIRSIAREVNGYSHRGCRPVKMKRQAKMMSQNVRGSGYLYVCLCTDGMERKEQVHKLILLAFKGPCPSGMQACHRDGNPKNNAASNLRWDTPKRNQADRIGHGTDKRGEDVGTAKYKTEDVASIKAGARFKEMREKIGISRSQFYRIKRGDAWAHIQ